MAIGQNKSRLPAVFHKMGEASDREMLTQLLELLDPKVDAERTAAALLDRFDRFSNIMDASADQLMKIPGIDIRLAEILSSYPAVLRQYQDSKSHTRERVLDTATAYQLVQGKFLGRKSEIMVLQILDSRSFLKFMGVIAEGNTHSVGLYLRDVIRLCLDYQASAVYISHNHPSENCLPSNADISTTKELILALSGIDVFVADHFIFTDTDFLSMRESGILKSIKTDIMEVKKQVIGINNRDAL